MQAGVHGLKPSSSGMLGAGVYCSRELQKAQAYAPRQQLQPGFGIVFLLRIEAWEGEGDPQHPRRHGIKLGTTLHGCVNASGLEEDCVWDPQRVKIVGVAWSNWGFTWEVPAQRVLQPEVALLLFLVAAAVFWLMCAQPGARPCPKGKFDSGLEKGCVECPPGHFKHSDGADMCKPCPVNTYAAGPGSTACEGCLRGEVSLLGQKSCQLCPAGTFASKGACEPCLAQTDFWTGLKGKLSGVFDISHAWTHENLMSWEVLWTLLMGSMVVAVLYLAWNQSKLHKDCEKLKKLSAAKKDEDRRQRGFQEWGRLVVNPAMAYRPGSPRPLSMFE